MFVFDLLELLSDIYLVNAIYMADKFLSNDINCTYLQLNSAWDALNKTWKERVDKLAEAMQAAVQYQDGLQVRWCDTPDIPNPILS